MARQKYWIAPANSATQVDKAGDCLIDPNSELADMVVAWDKVENWRVAHAYPLKVMAGGLRERAKRYDPDADIAQRLKRRTSIVSKLAKERRRLSTMQDIGGCRAIVADIEAVRKLGRSYLTSKSKHELGTMKDYILEPRTSGYRSVHLPYKFQSTARPEFNSLRVEIQLRTRLQHHWATAVETVGLFMGQDLKGSRGQAEWLRFFSLMGTLGAGFEKTVPVPGTPNKWELLREELAHQANMLHVRPFLEGLSVVVRDIHGKNVFPPDAAYYVLKIDAKNGTMMIAPFHQSQLERARVAYKGAEEEFKDRLDAQAVLISVDDVAALPRAYPNYFADTSEFLALLGRAVGTQAGAGWRMTGTIFDRD